MVGKHIEGAWEVIPEDESHMQAELHPKSSNQQVVFYGDETN